MVKFLPKDTRQNQKRERIFLVISELPSRRNQGGKEVKKERGPCRKKRKTGVILGVGAFSATERVHKSFRIGSFTKRNERKGKGELVF